MSAAAKQPTEARDLRLSFTPTTLQSENHSAIDSVVQNDHRMQMKQKVATVFSVSVERLRQVQVAFPSFRSRPCFASQSELTTTSIPRIVQKRMSCQTNRMVPRSQNHW